MNARRIPLACLFGLVCTPLLADPCGMVPPITPGGQIPIARIGYQQTYVFYKNGVETFIIRPGFKGGVDNFGMLIPFPTVPELRKVSDNIFSHMAAAVDPPEIVIDLRPRPRRAFGRGSGGAVPKKKAPAMKVEDRVKVIKKEAVGMYEVVVLDAGSAKALQKWMDEHKYVYPKGMDNPVNDYVKQGWCFVAVKTRVGTKTGSDPKPGQRDLSNKMPKGSTFDGHVQAMGFRFRSPKLVVPMRLSAFNQGNLHNVVYVLADEGMKINSIPEEYVVRQLPGKEVYRNLTGPLPLRVIGGTVAQIPAYYKRNLKQRRNPEPHNGAAKEIFAADLLAVQENRLSHPHEVAEKMLLSIGEELGLRGGAVDTLNEASLKKQRSATIAKSLASLDGMTLTVIDGNFPRKVIADKNLTFASFKMPARKNSRKHYDATRKGPAPQQRGQLTLEAISATGPTAQPVSENTTGPGLALGVAILAGFVCFGLVWFRRK